MKSKISVIGSGGWGTAMAVTCADKGFDVTLWSLFPEEIKILAADRENKKLLAGIKIPAEVLLTSDIDDMKDASLYILAVPSFAVRSTLQKIKHIFKDGDIICSISKGLEEQSLKRISEVIEEEAPQCRLAVLSGPSHAEEVGRRIPTTVVAASRCSETADAVQDMLMTSFLRIYTSDDVVGTELGGALKNVIALAAGICDGMGLGDNTKAALMTRGIAEMVRLGVAMGAREETFRGLAGIGDLIVTCTSMHSRNRRCGILIGNGKTTAEALAEVGMTVEGYKTAAAAYDMAQKKGVSMPIITEIYNILYKDKSPVDAISELMSRPKTHESEQRWK